MGEGGRERERDPEGGRKSGGRETDKLTGGKEEVGEIGCAKCFGTQKEREREGAGESQIETLGKSQPKNTWFKTQTTIV